MKKHFFYILLLAICVSSCQRESRVERYKKQKFQQDSIALVEQQKTMAYYQSQLPSLTAQADSLIPLFVYEKKEQYQDKGFYVIRGQQSAYNPYRCYMQPVVRDDGQTSVKCFYYGAKKVSFERVLMTAGDTEICLTGQTHGFDQNGWHAILTLEDSTAMQALQFVDAYHTQKIAITYASQKHTIFKYILSEADKKNMIQALRMAVVMQDINELEKRIYKTSLQIEKYQKRLQPKSQNVQ